METAETLEQMQARHRKEQRDLVGRVTSKKKNATKKTRKGVNDECAEMERRLKEKHAEEVAALTGGGGAADAEPEEDEDAQKPEGEAAADAVAEKLRQTKISEPEDEPQPAQTQTHTQGQGAKKRNRQRERMARRAAEHEAAAVAAEEEARGMTDHRGIERTYMAGEFRAHSLVEKEVAPDGHCLFSAVADQLAQRGIPLTPGGGDGGGPEGGKAPPPYKVVRGAAAAWMAGHPDDFAPFLEEDLEAYVGRIRDTAEWGGQLELAALANVYGVEIRVVQDGRTERIGPTATGGGEGEEKREIWLAYYRHGYGLGEHYNSLRKTA